MGLPPDEWLAIAERLLEFGQSCVLESGFWERTDHYLDPTLDELWRRVEKRNLNPRIDDVVIIRKQVDLWSRIIEAPDAAELALFDPPRSP